MIRYWHSHNKRQDGSAMWFILIGIVLFAAVSATITQSGKGNTSALLGPEKAKIYAGEIMNYANQLSGAVRRVMAVNNCSDTQISFEEPPFDGSDSNAVNNNAPSDFSCHIFHPDGGGVTRTKLDEDIYEPSQSGTSRMQNVWGDYLVTSIAAIDQIGTTCFQGRCMELLFWLPNLRLEVCEALNKRLGVESIDDEYAVSLDGPADFFQGSYSYPGSGDAIGTGSGGDAMQGKKSACFVRAGALDLGQYTFYHTLIAR